MNLAFTHNSKLAPSEPEWGSVDKGKLPRVAFARKGEADKKSTWGFPHHWVKGGKATDANGVYTDGTLYLHKGGLNAAWSAAHGGRSGQKAEQAVISHLRAHYAALGIKKAELQAIDPNVDVAAVDQELIDAGVFTAEELEGGISGRIAHVLRCCSCQHED